MKKIQLHLEWLNIQSTFCPPLITLDMVVLPKKVQGIASVYAKDIPFMRYMSTTVACLLQ